MLQIVLTILAFGSAVAGDLESETAHLESLSRANRLTAAQALRLGEIYFLTSRCGDVAKVVRRFFTDSSNELVCACAKSCMGHTELARLARFRSDLAKKIRWKDQRFQEDWRKVEHMPEARYWALKYLRSTPESFRDPVLREARSELEKSLESLEVKP
ncbi:MAG: hypothetical protein HY074_15305 [Deltaproteobacteria bacterium]|nr:hypothetical protein [Deltaproteobacteria bacterium]